MQLQVAAATPGPQHELLAAQAGEWDVRGRVWMEAGGEPMDVTAEAKTYLVLGGRFLAQEWTASIGGAMSMEGLSFWGYDNVRKKHIGVWMDNFGTAIALSQGGEAKDGRLNMMMQSIWPDGQLMWFREQIDLRGPEGMSYRGWLKPKGDPQGEEFLAVEMNYLPKRQ
jgi:hypothetical protein